jgi:hypothetical protein
MMRQICVREPDVIREARMNRRGPAWDHLAACPSCQEAVAVAEMLASVDEDAVRLPDAGLLYWRAQLRQRRTLAERATSSIRLVQRMAAAAAGVIVLAAGTAAWPLLARVLPAVPAPAAHSSAGLVAASSIAAGLLAVTLVMCWWTATVVEDA